MRALPVDVAAVRAPFETIKMATRVRQQLLFNGRFRYLVKHAVTVQAARERLEVERRKSSQYFNELIARIRSSDKVTVCDGPTFEERLIARQQYPIFS